MRILQFVVLTSVIISGCVPYPRYGRSESNAPREREVREASTRKSTEDYLRFGALVSHYLGRPYKGGSSSRPGLDCSLFTQEIMRQYANIDIGRSVDDQREKGRDVPRTRLAIGDLVFFVTERDRVSHVGIYVGYGEFVHASSSQGVMISALDDPYWAERFAAARRVME